MKKKLEAELISIAHRILKLKNKSEVDQLLAETQQLYEKLSVLKFVEENFADVKPTIGRNVAVEILETAFDEKEEMPVAEKPKSDKKESSEKVKKAPADEKSTEPEIAAKTEPQSADEKPSDEVEKAAPAHISEMKPEAENAGSDEKDEMKSETTDENQETSAQSEDKITEAGEAAKEPEKEETEPRKDSHGIIEPDKPEAIAETEPVTESGISFEQPEAVQEAETAKSDEFFKPSFEWAFDQKTEDKTEEGESRPEESRAQQSAIAFEDLLGAGYKDPVFVKPGEVETEAPAEDNRIEPATEAKKDVISISRFEDKVPVYKMGGNSGAISLNDRVSKGITVGLNDRIAFVKNLFNNSNEEYNRVLSQLLTFDTFDQAKDFIDNMVKPDYGNWEGRDEYAQRFMEVVERKFS